MAGELYLGTPQLALLWYLSASRVIGWKAHPIARVRPPGIGAVQIRHATVSIAKHQDGIDVQ